MSYKMPHPEKCGILRCTGKTIRQGKLIIHTINEQVRDFA